jgi:hypothetical protein
MNHFERDAVEKMVEAAGENLMKQIEANGEWCDNVGDGESVMVDGSFNMADMMTAALHACPYYQAMKWRPIEEAPRDGTKVFLYFEGLDYSPIASWECFEGGEEDGTGFVYAWCFADDSFGENGDGWLYSEDKQPTYFMPMPPPRKEGV